jgi:hypothetical protein
MLWSSDLPLIPRVEDIWSPNGDTPKMLLEIEAELGMEEPLPD